MTLKEIAQIAMDEDIAEEAAKKVSSKKEDGKDDSPHGIQEKKLPDGNIEFSFVVNINVAKYGNRFGLDIPDDSVDLEITEKEEVVEKGNGGQKQKEPAQDAAVSYSDQVRTTLENCRARNPLTCRSHGTQAIARDIEAQIRAAGAQGQVSVEFVGLNRRGVLSAMVTVVGRPADRRNILNGLRQFAGLPGVELADEELTASGRGANHSYSDWVDIDTLNPDAQARWSQGEEPREETPTPEQHSEQPERPTQIPPSEPPSAPFSPEPASAPEPVPSPEPTPAPSGEPPVSPQNLEGHIAPEEPQPNVPRPVQPVAFQTEDGQTENRYPDIRAPEFLYNSSGRQWRNDISALRGKRYNWPVRGRDGVLTAEQVTPELVKAVAANLPTGRRGRNHAYVVANLVNALADPVSTDSDYQRGFVDKIEKMAESNNVNARRFRQIFDALHPGYFERRARQRVEAENRSRVDALSAAAATAMMSEALSADADERVVFSEETASDATDRLAESLGENFRSSLAAAMNAFRETGIIPDSAQRILEWALPEDHPLREAGRQTKDRIRRRIEEAKRYRVPKSDSNDSDLAKAREKGFGVSEDERSPFLYNDSLTWCAPNCYINTVTQRAQKHGINAKPKPGWDNAIENGNHFAKRQLAYAREFKPVQDENGSVDANRMREVFNQMQDGDSISAWSGSHNVLLTKHGSQFYEDDGYFGNQSKPVRVSDAVSRMSQISPAGYEALKNEADGGDTNSQAKMALLRYAARNSLVRKGREFRSLTEDEIDSEMRKLHMLTQASFIIPRDAPILPEEWELLDPA